MQRDGRLARSRRAAHDDETARRLGDQLELIRVDETGDVGQVLVGPHRHAVRRGPQRAIAAAVDLIHPQRRSLAALQPRRRARCLLPVAVGGAAERPLGRVDPLQGAVAHRDGAAHRHRAGAGAAGDLLVVFVTLLVAIEQARDGGVAPVDDADAAGDERRLAEADIPLAVLLAQAEMAEIGRLAAPRAADPAQRGAASPAPPGGCTRAAPRRDRRRRVRTGAVRAAARARPARWSPKRRNLLDSRRSLAAPRRATRALP